MKSVFASKINWVALITFLVGSLEIIKDLPTHVTFQDIVMTAIGILTFVLRTWFTSQPVTEFAAAQSASQN